MNNGIMAGKRGLVMGVANNHSIAWGIAKTLAEQGAEIAFSYQGDQFKKRLLPLAKSIGSDICIECDVANDSSIDNMFEILKEKWSSIDFIVHAIAYSDKEELKGRYIDTTRDNFCRTLAISCYSFTAVASAAEKMMPNGGSMITLSYSGAERVMPSYNVMGVAKAALESSVRYLATDLGSKSIRVNSISAGPMRTLAGSAISGARFVYNWQGENSPLRRNINLTDIGGSALYLLSDLSSGVTGETHHVDSGYHVIGMAVPE